MAFSIDIKAAADAVADDDLSRVLSDMLDSAEQNAWDSMSEENKKLFADSWAPNPSDIPEYESCFSGTLETLRGHEYADEAHLAELADEWFHAYPEAAKLTDLAAVAAMITTQRAKVEVLTAAVEEGKRAAQEHADEIDAYQAEQNKDLATIATLKAQLNQ